MFKKIIVGLTVGFCLAVLGIGGYNLERAINWKMGYGDRVEKLVDEKLQPLIARIEELEK